MPSVTYIEFNGAAHTVEVPVGTSLMRGAVDNNIAGIDADCGGECACATCHVWRHAATIDSATIRASADARPGSAEHPPT